MIKAYTYYLYHKPTNKKYYGVRWAKNCSPNELWVKYFSSSKKIWKLIEIYGKESFYFEIRKTFDNIDKAILWEEKVLKRLKVLTNPDWLNQNISGCIKNEVQWLKGKNLPEHVKIAISNARKKTKGKYCWMHKDNHETRILKTDKELFVNNGYKLGRTPAICKMFSELGKTRTGSRNPFYGKSHNENTKNKISKANSKNHPN